MLTEIHRKQNTKDILSDLKFWYYKNKELIFDQRYDTLPTKVLR